jgi:uncharacterized cupredoxin-like copper-binding protein
MKKANYLLIGVAALIVGVSAAAILSIGGNGSTTAADTTTAAPGTNGGVRVIEVMVGEFEISDLGPIAEGETIEFLVTNMGALAHEFEITDLDAVDAHLAGGHSDHDDGLAADVADPSEAKITIEPGQTETLIVTFDDPTEQTLAVCLIPGHFEAGMTTSVGFAA